MIKIIEEGQKTFTKTCDRCGCKFQYDLSDLSGTDYINCPCCHTTLVHVGPKAIKIDLGKANRIDWSNKTPCNFDTGKINVDDIRKHTTTTPYKVEVGDGGYNYGTTTNPQYINPNPTITISKTDYLKSDSCILTGKDPNATVYVNKLPDDMVDDPYNNVGSKLPDDVKDWAHRADPYAEYRELMEEVQNTKRSK